MAAFTQCDVDMVRAFSKYLDLGLQVQAIETNNDENDTLNLVEYTIIRSQDGKFHVDYITIYPGCMCPPEQIETCVGEYFTLPLALTDIARDMIHRRANIYFEDILTVTD